MDASIASAIAVVGTLLGSVITYLFQSRGTRRAEQYARSETLRRERLAAYSAFAGALTDLRRGVVTLWFRQQRAPHGDDAVREASLDADRLGAVAEHARFRLQLLAADSRLVGLADAAFSSAGAIRQAVDRKELAEREGHFHDAVTAFITAASIEAR
ncbi:hypothetical protein Cs7R123_07710 [Catellatospora sp. TT07R-123]|uniref:hypothetical protein n=1 Tax=Catellatospora sp. TT07R-123 TaxID=2733863 RepID=UPI001B078884|nr:hypothetical protein [Catellatospora sp. TT07R-123]GHJ43429.1 hypothetical protein Cs7R123_07710 [Catellatospora sp. TT07R-123]